VNRAQSYAEGALFVDVYGASNAHSRVAADFSQRYRTTFGEDASGMEAIAYDAGLVLAHALDEAGGSYNRSDLLNEIEKTKDLKGVTGEISFKEGQLDRSLQVLTVQHGQIVEAAAAPTPTSSR
jgi:ABC-type branched-subunit amino acid transport system substrate-binding protein